LPLPYGKETDARFSVLEAQRDTQLADGYAGAERIAPDDERAGVIRSGHAELQVEIAADAHRLR